MYYYIHGISYWYGNHRLGNLTEHVNRLKQLFSETETKLILVYFVICVDFSVTSDTKIDEIEEIKTKNETDTIHINILYRFNTGGTIKSLWDMYNSTKQNNITSELISIWEDDQGFNPKSNWLNISIEKLNKGNIMVGSLWSMNPSRTKKAWGYSKKENVKRIRKSTYPKYIKVPGFDKDKVIWFDGNVYIFYYTNLHKIEQSIGVFTLAPETERYTYIHHGIQHGELGFPTRVCNSGLTIDTIPMEEWIQGLDIRSNHEPT